MKVVVALGAVLTLARVAEAGPPLICHPFDAGKAALLPWENGQGWNTPSRSYDVKRLTTDTMRLLSDAPILARMENMRRATIYASQDHAVAAALLAAVLERAQTATSNSPRDALVLFDAGYLIESYRQASAAFKWDMLSSADGLPAKLRGESKSLDGYGFVRKALQLSGPNAEMEFAASLMKNGTVAAEHRRRAEAGAPAGSLLAKNLAR